MNESASSVIQAIKPFLSAFDWNGVTLSVDESSVHLDNGWWQVSLQPSAWPERLFPVIEEMGLIADRLDDERHLKVMFSLGEPVGARRVFAST